MSTDAQHQGYVNALLGSATAAYTTPAYVSVDEPRSISLLYASGMAQPTALVQVDARNDSDEAPVRLSIRVQSSSGAWATFVNGSQELFYTYTGGTNRLSAQFETGWLASGAYLYGVVVRSYWSDGTWMDAPAATVRVLVVNARASSAGVGWIIAGVQSVVPAAGGVFVNEGDGTARWFTYPGTCLQGSQSWYCSYVSGDGDFSRLAKNSQTGGWTRYHPDGIVVEFGADGRMTAVSEAGLITRYGYDGAGRLSTVTDPAGSQIRMGYDASGRLAWIQDPTGRTVNLRVLSSGVVDAICDPVSCAFTGGYDGRQRLSWHTDRGGARWDYEYSAHGKLARVIAPTVSVSGQGNVRPSTRLTSLEEALLPAAGSGTYAAPAPARLPGQERLTVTDAASNVVTLATDRFGNPTRIEEPLGRVTSISRDQHGRPTRTTAFNGDVTEYTYQGVRPATVRDVTNDRTTTYTWQSYITGPHGMYPDGQTWRDYPLQVSTPGEPTVKYERRSVDPYPTQVGSARSYVDEWDAFNRPLAAYGPGGHTRYFYAAGGARNLDSLSVMRGTDTLTTRYTRDPVGRVTRTVNPDGVQSTAQYDSLNRMRSVTGPGGTTNYGYAPAGWLQTVTDARSQQYTYQRNAVGWLEWERDPRGQTMTLGYDVLGRQVSATNRRNQTVRYAYDALGQMTRRTAHEGGVTTYTYAADGTWMAVQNAESSDTVRLRRGSMPSVDQVTVRNGVRFSVNTRNDVPGNYTGVLTSWGYNVLHVFENDESGRLRQLLDMNAGVTALTHDAALNRTIHVLPSGDSIIHEPEGTRYTDPSGSAPLGRYYRYDGTRRLLQRGLSTATNSGYAYDGQRQVTGETRWENHTPVASRSFTYDGVGNPTHSAATVGTGNRLQVFDGFTLSYDEDGNITRKYKPGDGIDWAYEWNSLGQLVAVGGTSDGALTGWNIISYGYDGSGRRVRKTVNGVTTRYIYDGQHVIAETDAAGNVTREFIYYPGVDQPHSMRVGGQTFYYVADHQGNVTGLVNASGTLVNRYSYTPFGEPAYASEGVANPLRFAGGHRDAETGLYYNRARFYDPQLHRFTSEDPLGLGGGINPYVYAGNNPITLSDPTGLNPCGDRQILVNGECVFRALVILQPVCSCDEGPSLEWLRDWRNYRDGELSDEALYMADLKFDYEARQAGISREEQARLAVQSVRAAGDLGVGLTPGVSTVHDVTVALTGYNVVTGEKVGWGGRGIALIGSVAPGVSGGTLRAGGKFLHAGLGNITSGRVNAGTALRAAERWLGAIYREIHPGVFRSADGTRQFRMTDVDLAPRKGNPHVHFESIGPDGRTITENGHVYLVP